MDGDPGLSFRRPVVGGTDLDIVGYEVEALDGSLGTIDEETAEIGPAYVVLKTRSWILGRKVLLPAGAIREVDPEGETVYVDRTRDQVA